MASFFLRPMERGLVVVVGGRQQQSGCFRQVRFGGGWQSFVWQACIRGLVREGRGGCWQRRKKV